jgi:GT2 family glycosyltransferase
MDNHTEVGVLALNVVSGPYTKNNWNWKDGDNTIGFIGCGAILRKETYDKIGGYADWMFLYVNEWEYGLRCIDAGYVVRFFENSRVQHRASAINRSNKRLFVFVQKHEMAIIYKHFPYKRIKYILRATLNNIKGELARRDFQKIWFMILGIKEFLKMKSSLTYTPVSKDAQMEYVRIFHNTKRPASSFITNRVSKALKMVGISR